jgi:uncharacterized lipoprotein YddW (UPF0748 family)
MPRVLAVVALVLTIAGPRAAVAVAVAASGPAAEPSAQGRAAVAEALPGPAAQAGTDSTTGAEWAESPEPGSQPAEAPAESLAALRTGMTGVDYLWVLRTALVDSAAVDSTVERARRMGVRGLLVQVVGRGDAWYRSDLLPRAEPLSRTPRDFDPLGHILTRARGAGLEVHAWVNCMLVWSAPRPPADPRHVVRAHPEWVTCLRDGRPLTRVGPRERRRLGIEGVYLSPAHPGVRRWVAQVAGEIAARYEVDGIHLDYIRMPDAGGGYDPTTRARFALSSGVDPLRTARLPAPRRAAVEASWRAFLREQVTGVVSAVRDTLARVRPGVALSATSPSRGAAGCARASWTAPTRCAIPPRSRP